MYIALRRAYMDLPGVPDNPAVPLKAVCALEEVADSCVTDLRAKATQRSVAPARSWTTPRRARCGWSCETLRTAQC